MPDKQRQRTPRSDRAGRQRVGLGFDVGNGGDGKPAAFIFANLNGSISAWNGAPLTQAFTQTSVAGASFTGLAINQTDTRLFAANDGSAGGIAGGTPGATTSSSLERRHMGPKLGSGEFSSMLVCLLRVSHVGETDAA